MDPTLEFIDLNMLYKLPMPTFPDKVKVPRDLRHSAIALALFLILKTNTKSKAWPTLKTIYTAMWPDAAEPRDGTELCFQVLESWGMTRTRTHVWGGGKLGWDYHMEGLLARIEQAKSQVKVEEV